MSITPRLGEKAIFKGAQMVSLLKSLLSTNIAVQRKCLKLMGDFVQGSEKFVDKKEVFLEEFFPRAQVSEEKLKNLFRDTSYKLFGRVKFFSTEEDMSKNVRGSKKRLKKPETRKSRQVCPKSIP